MKGFILKPHEAKALAAGKPVVIWRALKKPLYTSHENPPRFKDTKKGDWFLCPDVFPTSDNPGMVIAECLDVGTYHSMGNRQFCEKHSPFPIGVPLFGKETWYESGHSFQTYPEDDDWAGWSPRGYKSLEHIRYALDGLPPIRGANDWSLTEPHSPKFIPDQGKDYWRKQPSVHMPEWASRITLTLSDVRVRRPCDVTEEEAKVMVLFHDGRPVNHHGYRHRREHGFVYKYAVGALCAGIRAEHGGNTGDYWFSALATPQPKEGA